MTKHWGPLAALLWFLVASGAPKSPQSLETPRPLPENPIQHQTEDSEGEATLYFPDYVDGGGWSVQLALSNLARRAGAAVVVTAYDQDGQRVRELFGSETAFEIPPLGSRVLSSAGTGPVRRGWIEVRTGPPAVSGLLTYRNSESGVEVGVAPVELGDRFALYVEETSKVGSGLAVFKPDPDSRIELRIRDESGRDPLEGAFIPGENFHQSARTLSEWFDVEGVDRGFLRDFRGLLLLRTEDESEFAPLGLRFGKGTGALSAVPVIRERTREAGERTLLFPDYVEGGGWSVQLALSNVDPNASAKVVVTAHDQDGRPVPDLFDAEAAFDIPSLGSRVLRSGGAGEIRRGWIQVRTGTPGVSGSLIYGHSGSGVEVGVAPVEMGNHFSLFVEENGEVGAGLAVFKPDPDSRIELRIRDESGRDPLEDVFIPWRDFRQSARTLSEWFDVDGVDRGFLREFRGLLLLRTEDGSPFAPLGLRFGKGTGALSAVPVIRIVDGVRIDGGVEIDGGVGIDGGGQAQPPTVTLSVSPSSIDRGQSTTLRWSSTNAESVEITPEIGEVPTSGTRRVSPTRTTTYRITVRGADGQTATESVTVTVAVSERQALVALYEATDGPNWVSNENWLTDAPLGDWYGVTTNDEGRVVALTNRYLDRDNRWTGNNLSGQIPPEIGNLANLRELALVYANGLVGPIPPEIGNLANLTELDLRRNSLSGSIPAELGNLASLERLVLSENNLSGPIPPELGNLANLRFLWLNFNALSGPIPVELGNLANLVNLSLQFNDLTGAIPRSFLTLDRLRSFLVLGGNSLCVPGTSGFDLWLSGLDVDVPHPTDHFCNAADVAALTALYEATGGDGWTESAGWLGDGAVEEWYGVSADSLGRVTALDLTRNGLVGKLPASFGSLAEMTVLRIGGNAALSGRLPLSLATVPIDELHYADTELCVPADESFEAWLNAIPSHEGTGVECAPLTEREILETLYHATGGLDWHEKQNWLTDAPIRDWHGVDMDNGGRVYRLQLFDNNLTGSLPGELGQLDRLTVLDLGQNGHLTGRIPPQLGNLANLQLLHLQFTDLTGPIPPELGSLTKLTDLYFCCNRLSGPIPPELGNLVNLTRLTLGENELTGPIPSTLGNLPELQELNLVRNELTGPIPPELGNLSDLALLSLGQNDLTGPIPPELGRLESLRELGVANNAGMSGALPESLTDIRGLDELTTGGTGLCAPSDPAFRAWLAGIRKRRVALCDGGDAAAYLVQSVQSRDHPVPLVAGERALLRVFPTALRASNTGMPPVRARFYLDDRETHVANIPAASTPVPTEVDEGRLAKSANAEIPGHVVQPGLEMVIEIDPQGTLDPALGVAKRIPEAGRLAVEVFAMPTLDLTVVPFLWAADPDSAILGIASGMAADPENHEMLWATRTLLPVGDMIVRAHEPVMTTTKHARMFFDEMVAIRALEGGTGHWMAMMSGDVDNQGGFAVGNRLNYSFTDAKVIAHEIGHNMSLYHAPCGVADVLDGGYPYPDGSSGSWGYDHDGGGVLVHPSRPDLMSYCAPEWVSDYHFTNALRYRLFDEGSPSVAASATHSQSLLVWGGIGADTVPYLEPAFVVEAPPTLPDSTGAYEVMGRTAGGSTLFSLSFAMPEVADGDGSSSFAFVLPVRPGWEALASITLTGPGGSVTLDQDTNRPVTILENPRTGQIRGILRGAAATAQNLNATVSALSLDPGLERLTSRGIPDAEDWER